MAWESPDRTQACNEDQASCRHLILIWALAEGIQLAQQDGIDWILHIDTDELMYPGGASHYSLQQLLADVPEEVDTLVFPNYESLPERNNVVSPFEEVNASSFNQLLHELLLQGKAPADLDFTSLPVLALNARL